MAENISKALFEVAEYVYRVWQKIPRTKVLNQEVTINVPESTVEYSMFIKIPTDFRTFRKPIELRNPSITRVSASSLHPFPMTVREALSKYVDEDGFLVHALFPKLLPKDTDLISETVEYRINNSDVLHDLVDRQSAHEPSGSNKNEYWMSAKLKHPKDLTEHAHFKRFDLRDVDVTVDVGVHNELQSSLPSSFIRRLRMFFETLADTDPRRQHLAYPQLRRLSRTDTAGREWKILVDLEALFLPTSFCKYVNVTKDFRFSNCYKGAEFYELPIDILPKKMSVIARTDLTLDNYAAEGVLIYDNTQFVEAVKEIVAKSEVPKKKVRYFDY